MKIFTSAQIHELDQYTIANEPVSSIDLMERAAQALAGAIMERWGAQTPVVVFAGPGNNGGDALAVARILAEKHYEVAAYLFNTGNKLSPDCETNRQRLVEANAVKQFTEVTVTFEPPQLDAATLVVDGLFGSGLNKPLSGGYASLVRYVNQSPCQVVSLDMPSGLLAEDNTFNIRQNIIRADVTLTLQQKKLSMLLPDIEGFLGTVRVLDIGLSAAFIDQTATPYTLVEAADVARRMLGRQPTAHKGDMGHALLVAGSYGMAGAAVLAARACMLSGVGKLTVHTARHNNDILQISVPEAMVLPAVEDKFVTEPVDVDSYHAVGIGPGIGQHENTAIAMIAQVRRAQCPVVVDADALNILGTHRAWLQQLPKNIILTPHPKEFDRLVGNTSAGGYERLAKAIDTASHIAGYVLLKGHYTALCTPDGRVLFNTTGNAGMATAGSGDVLTHQRLH